MQNYNTTKDYEGLWGLVCNGYQIIGYSPSLNRAMLIWRDKDGYHFHSGWRDYALLIKCPYERFIEHCGEHNLEYIFPTKEKEHEKDNV